MKRIFCITLALIMSISISACTTKSQLKNNKYENIDAEKTQIIDYTSRQTKYTPNQYGDGYNIDFCGTDIIAYENSNIDPNREINMLINKMLYCMQNSIGVIPENTVFLNPILKNTNSSDGGDPDDPNYPTMRGYEFVYILETNPSIPLEVDVHLDTWIGEDKCYYDNLNGLSVKIQCSDGYIYEAYSLDSMLVVDPNTEIILEEWNLSDGMLMDDFTYNDKIDNATISESLNNTPDSTSKIANRPSGANSSWNTLEALGGEFYEGVIDWQCNIYGETLYWNSTFSDYWWTYIYTGKNATDKIKLTSKDGITFTCVSSGGNISQFYHTTWALTPNGFTLIG